MQSNSFNKRHAPSDQGTIFGVSKAKLASLPSNVRGEVIAVLVEADDAKRSGDPKLEAAAAAKVKKVLGTLDDHHTDVVTEKFFLESLKPLHGDHSVIRKFAKRAGVGS